MVNILLGLRHEGRVCSSELIVAGTEFYWCAEIPSMGGGANTAWQMEHFLGLLKPRGQTGNLKPPGFKPT